MCVPGLDPITMAAIAASTAGAAYNRDTQNNAVEETNRQNQIRMSEQRKAQQDESVRQRAYEDSQAAEVTRALFEASPERVREDAEAEVAAPDNKITAAAEEYNVPTLTGQAENEDVKASIGSQVAAAMARTKQMLRGAATLSAQGTGLAGGADELRRMGSTLQTIGSARSGSGGVARYAMGVPAASVTASTNPIGDLLMLGGQLAGASAGNTIGEAGGPKPFDIGSIFKKPKVN